jgi:hypothetical protein
MRLMIEIGLIWAVLFAVIYFPGRWLGSTVYRCAPSWYICLVLAEIIALLLIEALVLLQKAVNTTILPHVMESPFWFGIYFANICFLLPIFMAILIGYRNAGSAARVESVNVATFRTQARWKSRWRYVDFGAFVAVAFTAWYPIIFGTWLIVITMSVLWSAVGFLCAWGVLGTLRLPLGATLADVELALTARRSGVASS